MIERPGWSLPRFARLSGLDYRKQVPAGKEQPHRGGALRSQGNGLAGAEGVPEADSSGGWRPAQPIGAKAKLCLVWRCWFQHLFAGVHNMWRIAMSCAQQVFTCKSCGVTLYCLLLVCQLTGKLMSECTWHQTSRLLATSPVPLTRQDAPS